MKVKAILLDNTIYEFYEFDASPAIYDNVTPILIAGEMYEFGISEYPGYDFVGPDGFLYLKEQIKLISDLIDEEIEKL